MKRLPVLILFFLASQFAYGQACGIYRVEYTGNIVANRKEVVEVSLPTTLLLHGIENNKSEKAFIGTEAKKGVFTIQISSHLTTPYNDPKQLLSFYKMHSPVFTMKVTYIEQHSLVEKVIELDWDKMEVSVMEDGKFGTLFRFSLKDISI